ncbi:MAG: hypothetical protein ABIQ55_07565 [Gemmatimonadaceae bacterium]
MTRSRSVLRTGLAAAFIVAVAFIPVHKVQAAGFEDYTSPRNADVDARGAKTIEVRVGAGSLRIEGRPGITQVQVRGTARSSSRGRLTDIRLIAERRGDVVFIKSDMPDGNNSFWSSMRGGWNMALDLVIEVPTTVALDVEDGSGDSKFINVGPLRLVDGSGEIQINGVNGNATVVDGSGNLTIENVDGALHVSDGSGNINVKNVLGNFQVDEDGSGDIGATGVGGTMRVDEDGSGNIDVERVAGDFLVYQKGSGTIRSSEVKGKTDIPDRHRRRGD